MNVLTMGWKNVKLEEVAEFTNGGAWNSKEYTDYGISIVQVTNISNNTIDLDQCKYLPCESFEKYKKHMLFEGDLVIATVGSHPTQPNSVVGRAAIIPKFAQGSLLNQNAVRLSPKNKDLDKKYLGQLGKSQLFRNYIIACARGSANQVRMSIGLLKEMDIFLPPLHVQRTIASILSNYDDLIENNTRRIEILEQMAKLIYEEWFVKFRFPGHENVKMVPSELGEIPEGWKVRKIKDISEITKGMSYKSENLVDEGGCAFVNLKCINRGGGFRYEGLKRFKGKFKERHAVNQDDIVIAVTDMTQNREIISRPARIPKMDEETILISMDLVKITPKNNDLKIWLYALLKYSQFGETLKDFANGVNVLHLSTENMLEYVFLLPDSKLITKYTETVCNFYKIVDNFELKNQNLRKTRDLLLPKLISGEIDVSDLDIHTRNEFQES
jgi:type I restriction enzyme, S subunit